MNQYERYHIVEGPHRADILVAHTAQDALKFLFGIGLAAGGVVVWAAFGGWAMIAAGLVAVGIAYAVTALLTLISATRFTIADLTVEQISRFISEGSRRWDQSEIDRVVVYEQRRWGGRGKPVAWEVVLISQNGEHFPGEFRFAAERTAREFTRHLSELLGTSMDTERGEPQKKVAALV